MNLGLQDKLDALIIPIIELAKLTPESAAYSMIPERIRPYVVAGRDTYKEALVRLHCVSVIMGIVVAACDHVVVSRSRSINLQSSSTRSMR